MTDSEWWTPPLLPNGKVDIVQLARELASRTHNVGAYLIDCASICGELKLQLPRAGPIVELYEELEERLAIVEATWAYAADALLTAATMTEIETRHEIERA